MSLGLDLLYGLGATVTSPLWAWRLWRTGKWKTDWPSRFGRAETRPGDRPAVLLHGVSVGEIHAIAQLVSKLESAGGGDLEIVVSTTTDTGMARARSLFAGHHRVVRYPLDFTRCVRRFLDAVRPVAVALVELEVWPNFVAECGRRDIPVAVINGRLSDRSFQGYRRGRALVSPTFRRLAAVAAQDEVYADRFRQLGVPADRVSVGGNLKWDTAIIADEAEGAEELATCLGIDRSRPLVVCGSTGPGEESLFAEQLAGLRVQRPGGKEQAVQLLVVPRKPERFDEAAAGLGSCVRRSHCPDRGRRPTDKVDRFLLDSMGELRKAYALADVVVVGRSFCPLYGSDMIEPIALGKPTVVGPNTDDFRDIMDSFRGGGGVVQLDRADELPATVRRLLETTEGDEMRERGRAVIRSRQGASQRYAELMLSLCGNAGAAATVVTESR